MKIYVLTAEHFSTTGRILKAFQTKAGATAEAVELVNIMLKDTGYATGWKIKANASNWGDRLERLQDYHGAQYCYVEISELELGA